MTIIESAPFENGMDVYRTYTMALFPRNKRPRGPSLKRDLAGMRLSQGIPGDLKSDAARRKPDTSGIETPNDDFDYGLLGRPAADIQTSNGQRFCSLNALSQASGCDFGVANHLVRRGSIVPDDNVSGTPVWAEGPSANKAHAKLVAAKEMA